MKNKKRNQKQKRFNKRNLLSTYLVVLTVCIVVLFISVIVLYKENVKQNDMQSKNDVAYFLSQAIEGLLQEAPVASYSKQQFIDSAKVKFERTEVTSLLYSYSPSGTFGPPEDEVNQTEFLQFSSKTMVKSSLNKLRTSSDYSQLLELVPGVQACSRLFAVTFDDKLPAFYPDYSKINSKELQDGRTAYIWKANGDLCLEAQGSLADDIENVINTIESY